MKRIFTLILTVIMLAAIIPFGGTALAATDYSTIRVKLTTGNITTTSVGVSGTYYIDQNNTVVTSNITVCVSDGKLVVKKASTGETLYSGTSFMLMRIDPAPSAGCISIVTSNYGTRSYLGHMRFILTSSGYIQIVNHVPIEQYLYGVVGFEMSNTFPLEALKSQAVAARGYAIKTISTSGTYDIGDTSSDQCYKGYVGSYTNVIAAVDGTKHQVLMYGSDIARTYYAASNGGQTDTPKNVWGSYVPYYDVVDDPFDTRNPSSVSQKIFVPIKGYGAQAMPANMDLYLRTKAVSALSAYGVSSANDFVIVGVNALYAHTPKYPEPSRMFTKAKVNMTVEIATTAGPQQVDVEFDFTLADLKDTSLPYQLFTNSSLRMYYTENVLDGFGAVIGFNIINARYGHGVGMSQRGAQQRAAEGQTYNTILAFYYPGTTLTTLTISDPQKLTIPTTPDGGSSSDTTNAYVTASTLNMRSGPATSSSVLKKLVRNAKITVISENSGWYYISYQGVNGYVSSAYVKLTGTIDGGDGDGNTDTSTPPPTTTVQTGTVTASSLNLRSGPSTSTGIVGVLKKGATVTIQSSSNGWYLVSASGKVGYVSAQYIKVTGATTITPTPTAPSTSTSTPTYSGSVPTLNPNYIYAQVNATTKLYSSMSTSSSVLATIPAGYVVRVISRNSADTYYKVEYGTKTGYIQKGTFALLAKGCTHPNPSQLSGSSTSSGTQNIVVTGSNVNIRAAASTSSTRLGSASKGETFEYLGTSGSFYKINYKGTTAYISTTYSKMA
jgi:peptidoglycan hydrolase-like amidase/uncharacterized protein YraI